MAPELVCPACRCTLADRSESLRCPTCGREYPVVAGIPDLRLGGDRYLSVDDDRAKARALDEVPGGFADVLRAYWERTPEVPPQLAERYVASALAGVQRGDRHLERLGVSAGSLLDVGCGTGGLLVAAAARGCSAVGIDVALRWLVVARRRLAESGVDATLVAADGALPPFRAGSFSTVCCIEVVEHATDQRALVHWCRALAEPGGHSYVVTANRFSLAPEPTIGLVGVGWLPRAWAPGYVRRRRATRYQYFRAPSCGELRSWTATADCGGRGVRIEPAVLPGSERAPATRRVAELGYEAVRRARAPRWLLRHVGPYLEVLS